MLTLEQLIERERLSDELRSIGSVNIAQQPGETYEDSLRRRALLEKRKDAILEELAHW